MRMTSVQNHTSYGGRIRKIRTARRGDCSWCGYTTIESNQNRGSIPTCII